MNEQAQLIYQCSKTDQGKALLGFIEGECVKRFKGGAEDIQLQAGKANLWIDIQDEIETGKTESNKPR